MHIELSESAISWQTKARHYADEYLQPFEVEAELNGGVLPSETVSKQKTRAIKLGFRRSYRTRAMMPCFS